MAARYLGTIDGKSNALTQHLPVANGVTVTADDFVYWSAGFITSASIATQRLIGVVKETVTGDGTVTAQVIVEPTAKYLVDNDNIAATFAATDVGTYCDLTGATGAQLVDTSEFGTSGSLYCAEFNPQIDPVKTDTSYGVFTIAEHALSI